jgi:flagellar hook-associated protein 1 FlgK
VRSSFLGLEVAKRSIQVSQKALDITANNLSNVGTTGYTRQRVDTASQHLSSYANWQTTSSRLSLTGQGVNALGVSQVRDPYIDKRYRDIAAYAGEYDLKYEVLSELEGILDNIDNAGLTHALDSFKTALSTYATNSAHSPELASIVRNEAYNITVLLRSYGTDLNNLLNTNLSNLQNSVEQTNTLISRIVEYNKAIVDEYQNSNAGKIHKGQSILDTYGPNELLDARNVLIDELSAFGNIHVENNYDGSVKITMGGTVVVDGEKYEQLLLKDYAENGNTALLVFTNGKDADFITGELKGYLDLLNGYGPYFGYKQSTEYGIPYYIRALDEFASGFAGLMNALNGVTETDTSRAMFGSTNDKYDPVTGNLISRGIITASTINISNEWMRDARMIGEVYNETTGKWELSLNGNNANKLYLGMSDEITIGNVGDFKGSIYDYILYINNRLGQGISFIEEQYTVASNTAISLLDSREAISGVSDTEEGINMMTYQKWFNASSRVMTALDECLDRIINQMGIVGR